MGCPLLRPIFAVMKTDTYRWQDFAISAQRASMELVATALVLVVVAIAVATDHDSARDAHWQAASPCCLHAEDAPQLADVAKERVVPAISRRTP
jgi:hypothetical protein